MPPACVTLHKIVFAYKLFWNLSRDWVRWVYAFRALYEQQETFAIYLWSQGVKRYARIAFIYTQNVSEHFIQIEWNNKTLEIPFSNEGRLIFVWRFECHMTTEICCWRTKIYFFLLYLNKFKINVWLFTYSEIYKSKVLAYMASIQIFTLCWRSGENLLDFQVVHFFIRFGYFCVCNTPCI